MQRNFRMEDDAHEKNVIIEGSNSWEAEKKWFQLRIIELESEMDEMKWKREADLKGNERALAIFASKEGEWKWEKKQLLQQLEFQRFNNNEDILNKVESVAETSGKVINYSRYVAELKRQKDKVENMLRNSLAEMEEWKVKAQGKKHVDAALRSVTDEMLRLQKELEEKDAFMLSQMSKKDRVGFRDSVMQAELGAKERSPFNAKTRLRHYTDGEGSREPEAEKWKRLYLGLKFELDNLQIHKANGVRENEDHTGGWYLALTGKCIFSITVKQKSVLFRFSLQSKELKRVRDFMVVVITEVSSFEVFFTIKGVEEGPRFYSCKNNSKSYQIGLFNFCFTEKGTFKMFVFSIFRMFMFSILKTILIS
jgi:hypothetical protein